MVDRDESRVILPSSRRPRIGLAPDPARADRGRPARGTAPSPRRPGSRGERSRPSPARPGRRDRAGGEVARRWPGGSSTLGRSSNAVRRAPGSRRGWPAPPDPFPAPDRGGRRPARRPRPRAPRHERRGARDLEPARHHPAARRARGADRIDVDGPVIAAQGGTAVGHFPVDAMPAGRPDLRADAPNKSSGVIAGAAGIVSPSRVSEVRSASSRQPPRRASPPARGARGCGSST